MRKLLVNIIYFVGIYSFAQVGIGTDTPEQELHLAGNSAAIRIDGMNSSNNPNNNGLRNQPVYTNADGDLIIPPSPAGAEFLINEQNFIVDTTPVQVQTRQYGYTDMIKVYDSPPFTLTQPALLAVDYSLSFSVTDLAGTDPPNDGKPKMIYTYFYIIDNSISPIPDYSGISNFSTIKNLAYGITSQSYTNSENNIQTNYITADTLFNSFSDYIFLPAGNYSLHMYSQVYSSWGTRASDAFSINAGIGQDYLKIMAIY